MWYYAVHPGNRASFFFSFKNKQNIYIYIFIFSCRVAPEQVCMVTQSVDSPNLKLRIEACSPLPVGWGSVGGTQRDKNRAGLGTLLQAAHSNWEVSARRPSPTSRDPHHLLSGARNLRGGGPHRTQTFKEQEKRTLVPEATLQSHNKSPRTCHLLSPRKGGGAALGVLSPGQLL